MQVAPLAFRPPLDPEDRTRADLYAVLARLYADPPEPGFLRALAAAQRMDVGGANPLPGAWNRLLDATAAVDADAAAQEYTDLFVGVGKCEVNLHASHWQSGYMMEKPLAELRGELAGLQIARKDAAVLTEDHLSALCETMRLLVAGDGDRAPAGVAEQRNFLRRWLLSWAPDCCAAIAKSPLANYYQRVAELTAQFLALEGDSLAID